MGEANNLIYTPREHIPIGEPFIFPDGGHGILVKWRRGKKDVKEIVRLDELHELVVQGKSKPAVRDPHRGGTRPL